MDKLERFVQGLTGIAGMLVPQIGAVMTLVREVFPEYTQEWTDEKVEAQILIWTAKDDALGQQFAELDKLDDE